MVDQAALERNVRRARGGSTVPTDAGVGRGSAHGVSEDATSQPERGLVRGERRHVGVAPHFDGRAVDSRSVLGAETHPRGVEDSDVFETRFGRAHGQHSRANDLENGDVVEGEASRALSADSKVERPGRRPRLER